MFDDDDMTGGRDPRRGWNRAVIQYRSAKMRKPNVTLDDLLMPNGLGNLRMLWTCFLMGGILTLLYVWIPLIFLNVFVPLSGPVYAAVLGGALVLLTAFLYIAGTRESRRERELATRL
jgi:hypothetical protein